MDCAFMRLKCWLPWHLSRSAVPLRQATLQNCPGTWTRCRGAPQSSPAGGFKEKGVSAPFFGGVPYKGCADGGYRPGTVCRRSNREGKSRRWYARHNMLKGIPMKRNVLLPILIFLAFIPACPWGAQFNRGPGRLVDPLPQGRRWRRSTALSKRRSPTVASCARSSTSQSALPTDAWAILASALAPISPGSTATASHRDNGVRPIKPSFDGSLAGASPPVNVDYVPDYSPSRLMKPWGRFRKTGLFLGLPESLSLWADGNPAQNRIIWADASGIGQHARSHKSTIPCPTPHYRVPL